MDRDAFEQLLSRSLDEPQDRDCALRIEAAASADPALAALRARVERLERVLRLEPAALSRIDWAALRVHLLVAVRQDDAALDAVLSTAPVLDTLVDWPRVQQRISAAVEQARAGRSARVRRWRIVAGALAAAAALGLLYFLPPRIEPVSGEARVAVLAPAAGAPRAGGQAQARVSVFAPQAEAAVQSNAGDGAVRDAPVVAEVFLMIEPAPVPGRQPAPMPVDLSGMH
ncbi:MAG: hypothetical protein HRF50_09760 [Phycisphaerae bacterium]|jgi:hypothetical protein